MISMACKVNGWIPGPLWRRVKTSIPIARIDVILSNQTGGVVPGSGVIRPYANVQALPGERIRVDERLAKGPSRVLSSHGLAANDFYLVGVYPIKIALLLRH